MVGFRAPNFWISASTHMQEDYVSSYAFFNHTFMLASTIHLWATTRDISLPVTNSLKWVFFSTLQRSIGVIQGCLPTDSLSQTLTLYCPRQLQALKGCCSQGGSRSGESGDKHVMTEDDNKDCETLPQLLGAA
jgi:hypothetical protein